MQRVDGRIVLSPTDLTKHVACPHITTLDLQWMAQESGERRPKGADDALKLVFSKGISHERDYLAILRERGLSVVEIADEDRVAAEQETVAAMRSGVDVIYQATLYDGSWVGHADFLLRRERPSDLGAWSYDVADTKLARRLKVPALLQMAMYAERLTELQGAAPQQLVVVTGDKQEHPWRLVDVASYARRIRERLEGVVAAPPPTEPAPVAHCTMCRWQTVCEEQWEAEDDLVQVAGLRSDQRMALRSKGIATLTDLAAASPEQIGDALTPLTRDRLLHQARLQVREREAGEASYDLLPPEPGKGLQRLPEPAAGDVYLDFEGDPWAQDGEGREYLAGLWERSGAFSSWWAHDFEQEGKLVADLIDELMRRWAADPDLHIYHYAPYEITALQRMTARHATREAELDQLLRAERFVDLYAVVKQGLRISKPSYSIKKLEDFYWGHTRTADTDAAVADAMTSVVDYERWLTDGGQSILDEIERYNREDVRSTHDLHVWLEQRRDELAATGVSLRRPTPPELKAVSDAELEEQALTERLLASGHDLLAGCVGWHRREARPGWWAFFRYGAMSDEEIVADGTAIGRVGAPVFVEDVLSPTGRATSKRWRYTFPPQDFALRGRPHDVDTNEGVGQVLDADPVEGWVDVKIGARNEPKVVRGLGPEGPINDGVLRSSIQRCAERMLAGERPLGVALIERAVPTAADLEPRTGETPKDVVVRVGAGLDGQILAVQGPPGTGKTYAASALIRELLDSGKTVGVTALSHAVIENVLKEVDRPAWQKTTVPEVAPDDQITRLDSNDAVEAGLADGSMRLVGGTAWMWAREGMADAVDVLVIDEAGQFSLANAVAVAQSARSLVLLGDPQQLTQPTQAAHPFGAGASALDHLLDGHDTIPADRGVFLDRTFRMHPEVCSFVSELMYDGRLHPAEHRERQLVDAPGLVSGTGLRWVEVEHGGNVADSVEEAEVVGRLVDDLLTGTWTDVHHERHPMTVDDVLVVAPYNAHVAQLAAHLPDDVRVGTVDRFQGRQAPVVIYAMGSSSAHDAPRGVDFLFDLHRLNVAVSRAKALAVVVASPALLEAEVHTPHQLRAVNALCRYADLAAVSQ
ncbi:TM0106 family RecB-like putative nuclease [Luteipulveratus mongoliensis]|uniref:AAA+ ATPase domain-containing protein n=1 Tax=Luteipulveratus mongoliensis TaxID=571913 RepID=A0A0K1JKL8_9MICO|nr:TM0106 family RecB-like putative nuclease [Luteipulveratus mongoliensis]AKU17246.1 hypothetical protein VV02_17630 [Luteipulveratus mongoliensis]